MGTNNQSGWRAALLLLAGLVLFIANARGWNAGRVEQASDSKQQAGNSTSNQSSPSDAKRVVDDYVIGPADILAVNVWKDTELTHTVTVRPDGRISLPLVGEIMVSGLTAPTVQRVITQRLADYITNPQVTVIVQEVHSQSYVIVGKITHPGVFPLGRPVTVLEAIALAGGFLDFAKTNKIKIMRRKEGGVSETLFFDYKKVLKGQNTVQNVELRNGDTIVVP